MVDFLVMSHKQEGNSLGSNADIQELSGGTNKHLQNSVRNNSNISYARNSRNYEQDTC